MDDALKARLIGAAVLVALAVVLIPELLSGRKASEPAAAQPAGDRSTRSFTIELGSGSSETRVAPSAGNSAPPSGDSARQVIAPATPRVPREQVATTAGAEERTAEFQRPPIEPDSSTVRAADEPEPAAAAAAPAGAAPVVAETEPAPQDKTVTAGQSGWAVQVGAFGSVSAANKLVSQLQGAGYRAYVSPVTRSGKTLHRVRVGPEADRAAAEKLLAGLKARGLPTSVVASD